MWQIAFGAWLRRSRSTCCVTSVGKVRSSLPEMKASIAVERLVMIGISTPSRYGRPGFQYSVLRVRRIISFCLNSANLNGPVPIGRVRMPAAFTWHGYIGV